MAKIKLLILIAFITISFIPYISAQKTYMGTDDKLCFLNDTKLLKNGDIVLLESTRICNLVRVQILKPDGSTESILSSGRLQFHSFNELTDNNWVLTIITDPSDDVPTPYTFHTITFIDGSFDVFSTEYGVESSIPLEEIYNSAVINFDELVLVGYKTAYFTDFELSSIDSIAVNKPLRILKSPLPEDRFLYYQYAGEDQVFNTEDRFETEQLIAFNLGANFRDLHYLGNYAIIQDVSEISALEGIFGFQYLEQDKTIYDFRQQGQNLRYYTVKDDNTIVFKKLYLDENEVLRKDSFEIIVSDIDNVPNLHWDTNFKGITTTNNFTPLSGSYADNYRGRNYVLDYNLEGYDISTQNLDISIEDIEYTIDKVDTIEVTAGIFVYYADISMEVTVTNHTDEPIFDVHLHSSAFEGFNCAYNGLKVDLDEISIDANSSTTVTARYESLEFDNQDYLQAPLCVYAIGANNKFDDDFEDNIFCLSLLEFTSTNEELIHNSIAVSPNPAQDFIRIENGLPNSVFEIYTLQGEKVLSWERNSGSDMLDISTLVSGAYIAVDTREKSRAMFWKI